LSFTLEGSAFCVVFLGIKQLSRFMRTRIMSALAVSVFRKPPLNMIRYTSIKTAVLAFENIYVPLPHKYYYTLFDFLLPLDKLGE